MRLAYGVVTGRDQRVWDARGCLLPDDHAAPGAPVVLGPHPAAALPGAGDPGVGVAVGELARLVAGGGAVAAGAGVELCPGFVSARLDGVRGDRRDAVLAAAQALGLEGLHRLGDRAGVLVALFGAEATKPVAAAAGRAIAEGRWAALRLASAASGLLTAEQVERLLHLGAEHAEPLPHSHAERAGSLLLVEELHPARGLAASTMAEHLGRVLGPYPRRRRLDLLVDLWERVVAGQEAGRRKERRLATQGRQSRREELTARYAHHEDEWLLQRVRADVGHEPSLVEAARWSPRAWHWTTFMNRAMHNAMAATVLLRTAIAVADHGVQDGIARCAGQLAAAAALMDSHEAGAAARRVPGLTGLPARPGCYVRDLTRQLEAPSEPYVRQRLARAGEYAMVVMDAVTDLLSEAGDQLSGWSTGGLREWRAAVGHTPQRPPAAWAQPPVATERPPLDERLAARPGVPPEEEETAGDLLWFADLADALAQLNGHDKAAVHYDAVHPYADWDPDTDEPSLDSIPAALAGAAQLVSLGAEPPRQCRDWAELTAGLARSVEVTEAFTAAFRLPAPLAAVDGTLLPGTDLRVEWARDPRTLARWSAYMGNCIAGPYYVEEAQKGTCALAALRGPSGRIVANLEIRHRRQGWQTVEFKARFNADPDPGLSAHVASWLAGLPLPPLLEPPARERLPVAPPRRRLDRVFGEVSGPLAELAGRALAHPETVAALHVLDAMNAARGGAGALDLRARDPAATDALTALRRLSAERVVRACLDALPVTGLPELWRATGVRPLARAVAGLDPALVARYDHLRLLVSDAPLPGSLRKLARHEAIAPARSMEVVARRIRAALGRLARAGDPVLAQHLARRPEADVLCALVVAITSWPDAAPPTAPVAAPGEVAVPGFPRSDLQDPGGPWQRAMAGAVELGADREAFWERVAAGGLRVPVAWLGNGGWPALWQRAHRPHRAL